MFEAVRKNVTERLRGIRSPDGSTLDVTVKGNRLDNLAFDLSGPPELIEEARRRLKN